MQSQSLLQPRGGVTALQWVESAAAAEGVEKVFEAGANDEQVRGVQHLLTAAVEDHESVVVIPESETVRDAFDRVGKARAGQLDQRLCFPLLGDIRIDRNEPTARHRIAANLQDGPIGPGPFSGIGLAQGHQAPPDLLLNVAGAKLPALSEIANK